MLNEFGETGVISIPAERALTIYLDKRELVTLMTLGAHPELLVLGFLRNQRIVHSAQDIESITVDWEVGAAAVKTHRGVADIEARTARRVVTTGCGQGSMFGDMMSEVDRIVLSSDTLSQGELYGIVNAIRQQDSIYKVAGSVHGCALFKGQEMLLFVEDVGRHNAIDTIAGWMWLQQREVKVAPALATACATLPLEVADRCLGRPGAAAGPTPAMAPNGMTGADKVFYTTGRLTSEMVIKAAQMGIPIVVSRSGITQMGLEVAQRLGLCAIGRATHRRFLCYSGFERLRLENEASASVRAAA